MKSMQIKKTGQDNFREHCDRGLSFFENGDFESAKGSYLLAHTTAFFRDDIFEIALAMANMSPRDPWTKELISYLVSTVEDNYADHYALGILFKTMPNGKKQARKYFESALLLAKTAWARKAIEEALEQLK